MLSKESIKNDSNFKQSDLDNSLMRKDIALCGVLSHKKQAYVDELKKYWTKIGFSECKEVFIIGARSLTAALFNYANLKELAFKIQNLF